MTSLDEYKPIGLEWFSNICYFNSLLQLLFCCRDSMSYILNNNPIRDISKQRDALICLNFKNLLKYYFENINNIPNKNKEIEKKINAELKRLREKLVISLSLPNEFGRQHDVHEYYTLLMNSLSELYPELKTKYFYYLNQTITFRSRDINCMVIKEFPEKDISFKSNLILYINPTMKTAATAGAVANYNFKKILDINLDRELLDISERIINNNGWYSCGQKQKMINNNKYLTIYFNRIYQTKTLYTGFLINNGRQIRINEEVFQYIPNKNHYQDGSQTKSYSKTRINDTSCLEFYYKKSDKIIGDIIDITDHDFTQKINGKRYKLKAFCHHGGGSGGGHWTAFINSKGSEWFNCNDIHIFPKNPQEVTNSLKQSVFLLFENLDYVNISTPPNRPNRPNIFRMGPPPNQNHTIIPDLKNQIFEVHNNKTGEKYLVIMPFFRLYKYVAKINAEYYLLLDGSVIKKNVARI